MTDNCWEMDPGKRATFAQLKKTFDRLISASLEHDRQYMDLIFAVQEQLRGEIPGMVVKTARVCAMSYILFICCFALFHALSFSSLL